MTNFNFCFPQITDDRCFDDIVPTVKQQREDGIDVEVFNHKHCHAFVLFMQNYEVEKIELVLSHEEADRLLADGWDQQTALEEIVITGINKAGYYPIRIEDLRAIEISNDIDYYHGTFNAEMRGTNWSG